MEKHDFYHSQQQAAFKSWLFTYIRQSWWRIVILILLSLIAVGLGLLNPWPLKLLADSVFGNVPAPGPLEPYTGTVTLLYFAAITYVTIYLLQGVFGVISGYVGARFGFRLDVKIKQQLFRHILYLPIKAPNRLETADYVYRQNVETNTVSALVLGTFVTVFQSTITVVGILVILFILDWQLTILSLIVLPFLYLTLRFFGPRIQQQSFKLEQITSKLYTHSQESIQNADIVQSFNRQDSQLQKLTDLLNQKLHLQLKYTLIVGAFGLVTSLLTVMVLVTIVVLGGKAVFSGQLTFGSLLIFVTYAGLLYQPLEALSGAFAGANQNLASLKRVFEVVYDNAGLEDTTHGNVLANVKGQISFRNINFSYGQKQILKDINFTIQAGEKVAFVGPSGAGKSTILALVARFAIPDSGFIYIDEQELHDINLDSLRNHIALVDQEPKLFSISIAENIAFATKPDEKYPLPGIMAAAGLAYATEFIDKLPNTYDEEVEHTGGSLSGGQKQRIAFARAMYKQAPILLLDEPTSAQDVASEKHVLEAINKLIQNRTVLLVTHKLSLLAEMNRVFVVEGNTVQDVSAYGGLDAYIRYLEVHDNL